MMPWYVFGLVDRVPAARQGRGLAGPLSVRRVPGGFAIVERRADVPPVELGALKTHDAVVARLANAVPSILPVRFGTLMDMEDIEEALADRDEELAEAFDLVRDRVQFTWRRRVAAEVRRAKAGARGLRAGAQAVLSGADYLRQAARAAKPASPAAFRAVRAKFRSLVAVERFERATPSMPDSLYHLVDRRLVDHYAALAHDVGAATPALHVTGPFPPFAFTPGLL